MTRAFDEGMDLSAYMNMKPSADDLAWDHAMDISASIYERLNELGMSQKDLAEELGVSPGRISQIIKGNPGMSIKTLARIESALDFDLSSGFHYIARKRSLPVSSSQTLSTNAFESAWDQRDRRDSPNAAEASRHAFECLKGGLAA